jgi:thiol-disulfide isomerase/thioredoxin
MHDEGRNLLPSITMKSFLASLSLLVCATLASAADFDWKTRFPEGLVDNAGKTVDLATLKNKTVAVYCSAHWCPPCRAFTPELVKFANANKTKLAVVFISSDRAEDEMFTYMKETKMPWPAVPFKSAGGSAIQKEQGVTGIPTLLVYGKDGQLLTKNGRDLDGLKKLLGK